MRAETVEVLHEQEEAMGRRGGSPQRMGPRQHRKPQETRSMHGAHSLSSKAQLCDLGLPEQTVLISGSLKLEALWQKCWNWPTGRERKLDTSHESQPGGSQDAQGDV